MLIKYGRRSIAKPSNAIGGVIASIFGVFWTVMAFNIAGGDTFFPYFGILFIILGIVMAINHYDKGTRYIQAKKEYLKERERIKQKLKSVE